MMVDLNIDGKWVEAVVDKSSAEAHNIYSIEVVYNGKDRKRM